MRMLIRAALLLTAIPALCATAIARVPSNLPVSADMAPAALAKALQSKNPTEAAAAAYWLGFKGHDAVPEIPRLVAILGDDRPVRPSAYRSDVTPGARTTPGEEAAGALVRVGKPAIDPLITTLRSSSSSVARQNAAWALGQIDNAERESRSAFGARPKKEHE